MKIDLTEAMVVEHSDWHSEIPLELNEVSFVQGQFPVTDKSPVKITVHYGTDKKLQVLAEVSFKVTIPCDRCLAPVSTKFDLEAVRDLDLAEEKQPSYVEGTMLDADGLIFHEILLHWPAKVLCREDCRGLCPVCGADLNQGECGCDRQVLDPRMAAIQDLFNKFQA